MSEHEIVLKRLKEKSKMRRAHKDMMYLFVVSSTLIFVTLALIWFASHTPRIVVPEVYFWNTPVILGSSLFVILGQRAIQADRIEHAFLLVKAAAFLGVLFSTIQLLGWQELLNNDSPGSILFPFSVIHFCHMVIGMFLLIIVLHRLKHFKLHSRSTAFAKNIFNFWHFLGVVWLAFIGVIN